MLLPFSTTADPCLQVAELDGRFIYQDLRSLGMRF
jgi:hypothetical protein